MEQPTCKSGSYWHTWGRNHILARISFMELNRDIYFISIIMNVSFKTSSKSLGWQLKVPTICEHATCIIIFKRVKHFLEFPRFSSKYVQLREVCKKSKWKFKMAFAIRRPPPPPPLMAQISRHFFTPLFFFCN